MFAKSKTRGLFFILPVALFLVLVGRFYHPVYGFTSFLTMDEASPFTRISAVRETPVYLSKGAGSYDGQYYAQLAIHPLLNSPELQGAMDNYPYRARRILPSMIAWALACGDPFLIFNAYCIVNILAWLTLSVILWRLLDVRDARTWIAWLGVMFSAGALFSVDRALTDLVALAFIAGAIFLATRNRRIASAFSLAAAALCRETALLSALGILAPPSRNRAGEVRRTSPNAVWLCFVVAAPIVAWALYVRWQVGPAHDEARNFSWPLTGYLGQWISSFGALYRSDEKGLCASSLLTLVGLTAQALYIAVTFDRAERWSRLGIPYVLLMLLLGPAVWEGTPGAACRVLLPMTLAFNLLVAQRRSSFAWIVIGNLTIFSGLYFLKDVPWQAEQEISTSRTLSSAGIIRVGPGWYSKETSPSHAWLWAARFGELEIEHWPKSAAAMEVRISMRSITPALITISEGDTVLLEKSLGRDLEIVTVQVPLVAGRAVIRFSSSEKPVRLPGDTRPLNFQMYDPKIVLEAPR